MCGIFGFALTRPVPLAKVFRLLERLEVHQYPQEQRPVGGYGAGIAILTDEDSIALEKVGKLSDSPARSLSKMVKAREASVLVAHVRMPSPQFMETTGFRETAQPYVVSCHGGLTVVSVHNGNLANYKAIREKLSNAHELESEKIELIDSEVIPHYYEELWKEKANVNNALNTLFSVLEGQNTIGLLHVEKEHILLHLIHKGKTRGLAVWTNNRGEIMFCSRKELLIEELGDMLKQGKFKEKMSIGWREYSEWKFSLPITRG